MTKGITEIVHYPTLKTIMAIEEVVKKANRAISRNKILEKLPMGVMRSTLNVALDYLEKRGVVLETKEGYIWTFNPSKTLELEIARGGGSMKPVKIVMSEDKMAVIKMQQIDKEIKLGKRKVLSEKEVFGKRQ